MAWELANRQMQDGAAGPEFPLLVPLGAYKGEPWLRFLPRGVREAIVDSFLRFGDWRERGLSREAASREASQRVQKALVSLVGHLERLWQTGRLVLLLDGLNELPGGAEGRLRSRVDDFVAESRERGNRVAVACRVADYTRGIARLNRVELLPFDDKRIYQALVAYLGEENGHVLWAELIRPENQKLQDMLAVPLYVEVLGVPGVLEWDEAGQPRLPANRGALLARFTQTLMAREWDLANASERPTVPSRIQLAALAETAYRMRAELASRGSQATLAAARPFLVNALAFAPGYQPDWVLDLAAGAGLIDLNSEAGTFSFWKEPLEEYFAARHLLRLFADGKREACQDLWRVPLTKEEAPVEQRDFGEPPTYPQTAGDWEETTILAAGLAGIEEARVSPDRFVAAVLAVNPGLAGRCLHEGGAQVAPKHRQQVADTLLNIMRDRAFSVRARVPCGVLLGRLGDPRFHEPELFCLPREPWLGFIEVPAGPFRMGGDLETVTYWNRQAEAAGFSPDLYNDELGHDRPVEMPCLYWIARYPVTNAQFRCFVQDGGYTSERWRHCGTEDGRRWLDGERWSEELDQLWEWEYQFRRERGKIAGYESYAAFREQVVWPFLQRMLKDADGENYWADPQYNAPNQPVVGLTWHEAVAYANWLTEKLMAEPQVPEELQALLSGGHRIRLASEAEWEKAARGGLLIPGDGSELVANSWPARQWPWGDPWDPERCNSAEGDDPVRWLSPVGTYLDGASPYGCLDMIGNVWEWTRSLYRDYPYDPTDRREDPEASAPYAST